MSCFYFNFPDLLYFFKFGRIIINIRKLYYQGGFLKNLVFCSKNGLTTKNMPEQQPYIRPSWDEYFMKIVEMVGARGTCDRGRAGCVIAKDKRIISTGYAGSPIGLPHCDEIGHEMHIVIHPDGHQSSHCIRTTHAEQNAICQAAKFGIALDGAAIYVKMTPCYTCAKMIINAGIKRVVCANDYHAGSRSKEIFAEAGIQLKILNHEVLPYGNQNPDETQADIQDKQNDIIIF